MRVRILILIIAALLFGAIVTVPQIIEAKRSQSTAAANTANTPFQGQKQKVTVGASIRNDTSPPLREMKQQPVFKPKREANENPKIPHAHCRRVHCRQHADGRYELQRHAVPWCLMQLRSAGY
jgi:hypothetical protein